MWLWKLDSNLPGDLGQIGEWLNRAEELVDEEMRYTEKHEETANIIADKLVQFRVSYTKTCQI